jgi:MFS family permease
VQSYRALRGQGLLFLVLLWFLWFLTVSAGTLVSPVLPLIEDEFAVGHARATALVSLISLGSAAATFVFGFLASVAGYKRSILVAFLVSAMLFLLVPRAGGFFHLALLFLMIGVANGIYYPCSIPVITEHYHYTVWGKTLAIHDSAAAISVF